MASVAKFYVDLAFALTVRRPTGAARAVTAASFLLGTMSGSGVATTVTLGSITYPMLKRAGHDPESTGGDPYKTMMLTWKYALPCFLVPSCSRSPMA